MMTPQLAFTLGLSLALAGISFTSVVLARLHARRESVLKTALEEERRAREQLSRDISALVSCSRELGDRLRHQDQRHKTVAEKVNQIAQQVDGGHAIDQAGRLVEDGMAVEQVSRLCSLSKGEAALLERWKKQKQERGVA